MAKRGPAIGGLHSQGIVDDIIIPVAKKVFRATKKNALSKEVKVITKRHNTLIDKRRKADSIQSFVGSSKLSRKRAKLKAESIDKKLNKNMQSGSETSSFYRKDKPEIGLPHTYARYGKPPRPPVRTKAQTKELQKRLAEAKAKTKAATAVPRPPRVPPRDVEKMAAAKAANARRLAAKKPKPPMPPPPRPPKKK